MNKPAAMRYADQVAHTECIAWLDSDTLVIAEPTELQLSSTLDFTALPGSALFDIASTGDNKHESFWVHCLKSQGIPEETYPWTPSQPSDGLTRPIRMYWQGGAYAYRRALGIGQSHFELTETLIKERITSSHAGYYFSEQVGLSLATHHADAQYQALPASHNLMLNPLTPQLNRSPKQLKEARIIHYFGSLWEQHFSSFVQDLAPHLPEQADWLKSLGPLRESRAFPHRVWAKAVKWLRPRRANHYLQGCPSY